MSKVITEFLCAGSAVQSTLLAFARRFDTSVIRLGRHYGLPRVMLPNFATGQGVPVG